MTNPCTQYADQELVAKTLKNKDFFTCILERYEKKILHYILRLGRLDYQTAEDILQEVFLNVYKNLHAFQPKYSLSSWLYRIAHNQTMTYFRKSKIRPAIHDFSEAELNTVWNSLQSDVNLKKEYEHQERDLKLKKLLHSLPENYRNVLILYYLEEKNYQEICDILQKPVGTVSTLLNRAKKKFRELGQREKMEL